MSENSDEELVGDADVELDLQDSKEQDITEMKTERHASSSKREAGGVLDKGDKKALSAPTKPSTAVKKKSVVKVTPVDNDLLQAFAIGDVSAPNLKKAGVKKKHEQGPSKSKVTATYKKEIGKGKTEVLSKENDKSRGKLKSNETAIKEEVKSTETAIKEEMIASVNNGSKVVEGIKKGVKIEVKESEETIMNIEGIKREGEAKTVKVEHPPVMDNLIITFEVKEEAEQQTLIAFEKSNNNLTPKSSEKNSSGSLKRKTNDVVGAAPSTKLKKIAQPKEQGVAETDPSTKSKKTELPKEQCIAEASPSTKLKEQGVSGTAPSTKLKKTEPPKEKDVAEALLSAEVKKTELSEEQGIGFTEEDCKNMDNCLAEQMLNKVRQRTLSKPDVKYTVKVSPLEMADLSQPSVQQIIQLHPTTMLVFQHQAVKFRKKKGYAEAAFSTMTELKEFVYELTQLKVLEKRIDVVISALRPSQEPNVLSFVIHLNRNAKLLKLIDSSEDPLINKPIPTGFNPHKIEYLKVPSTANGAFMHSVFPFCNNVVIKRTRVGSPEGKQIYHGPLSVFYVNEKWMEATLECCTDFTVNGCPLSPVSSSIPDLLTKKKTDSDRKPERRRSSSESDRKHITQRRDSHSPMDVDKTKDTDDDDDSVSNMTRDVCADMLESIKKLTELEPDNPNMKKILEMQERLNMLQKSLEKSGEKDIEDPWQIHSSDSMTDRKLTPGEKSHREMQDLEKAMEDAAKAEREKEQMLRQQREEEAQKRRESEVRRKSHWARKFISDYKQEGGRSEGLSPGAERILRQREQRIKEREEQEIKRKKAEELRKQEEEQKRVEEERKEEERKLLIKKIEEARLRDSQKAASQSMWKMNNRGSSMESSSSSSSSRYGSDSKGGSKDKHIPFDQRSRRESTKRSDDGGVEERLAMFEQELAQQGKIERPATSISPVKSGHHYPSQRKVDHDGPVIIMEEEYRALWDRDELHTLPRNYKVRLSVINDRLCPVQGCPAKTCFRDSSAFVDHWSIFHEAETTMRFCPKCSAYFMNPEELENHMMKHHWLSSLEAARLVRGSRVKVIPNPSFRDPSPFLLPLSLSP